METGQSQNIPKKYCCELCNYTTSYSKDFKKHLVTKKHMEISGSPEEITKVLICEICNKKFKTNSGLWKHKNKGCHTQSLESKEDSKEDSKEEVTDKEVIMMLLKQNSELIKEQADIKNLILEIVKNGTHNTTTTHTNSHNKAFNLNFFLNETCKNAMNITDFVDSIKLQLTDLMEVGELGYVEGISKIIVKNLNNLDETVRPVHCTDKKRETMYIKDQGQWEKEDENKTRLKKAINKIADKNIKLLPQFREKYPEYGNSYSKISDVYNKMVIEVMETDNNKKDKIIKNISKAATIKENH
jgi:phenylpyruvate tautomerase PptA (4-oxalocrotonate tautomerase family)